MKLDQERSSRRQAYLDFVASIEKLPSLERAVAWLEYVSHLNESYGDQEAFVFLRSRGIPCVRQLKAIKESWKIGVQAAVQMCAAGASVVDVHKGTTRTVGRRTLAQASRVEALSTWLLRDFWSGYDRQELSLDATMIRTVEWGKIGGFDAWWRRLAKTNLEGVLEGGVARLPASYWLFNMCRSKLAMKLFAKSIEHRLEALQLPAEDMDPWRFHHPGPGVKGAVRMDVQNEYLSHLVFCALQIRGTRTRSPLIRRGVTELVRQQHSSGGWTCWESDKQPGVEATAKAIHALCLARPPGWKRAVEHARRWLLQHQHAHGCWRDATAPDVTYLTVLVLDALSLIDGNACTFAISRSTSLREPRFEVAFSFPGAERKLIHDLAKRLARKYSRKKIFYDSFHQPELARPNLDTHLQQIYHRDARLNVVMLCAAYRDREWCGVEWRAIRDLIKKKRESQIMFIRRGKAQIPGVFSHDGYISAESFSAEKIANFIHQRVQSLKLAAS